MKRAAEEAQRHDGQKRTVDQTHPHLLPEQMQLFGGGQVLVHQHADGDGQRLGADIARHIQHHGLEADDTPSRKNRMIPAVSFMDAIRFP